MLNSVNLVGRMVYDPELKITTTGKSVCTFKIANETGFGENKKTNYVTCVAWSKQAEFVSTYFSKGKYIAISGRLDMREYEKDGQKRTVYEVVCADVSFCGGAEAKPIADDSLPF